MMQRALVIDGVLKQYPYSFGDLRRDNPQVSFPQEMSDESWAEHGVVTVVATDRPSADGKIAVEGDPTLVDGAWRQAWTLVDAPRRRVSKAVITARLDAAGKLAAAMLLLKADDAAFARWVAPIPDVYSDDPATVALVQAAGADPATILAEEAT